MSARERNRDECDPGIAAGHQITFSFEGRSLCATEGQTVAAALIANGISVFGRSSKYHRPRGYRCGRGYCSCCSMRVDGLPGVRTCMTAVTPGMEVEREHCWRTADHDVLRASEFLSPLMPPGFYYRWFRRSPRLWGAFERCLARVAGQGKMPSAEAAQRVGEARCRRRDDVDVLVVGGGIAGMSAALAAADEGANVLLLQRSDRLGGGLADVRRPLPLDDPSTAGIGGSVDDISRFVAAVMSSNSISVLTSAEAIGWYEEGTVAIDTHPHLLLVDPATVVLATGAYELAVPFPNCDLPGVMLASGAQRLLGRHGVWAGTRVAFVADDDSAYCVALQFADAGVEVTCVADSRRVANVSDNVKAGLRTRGVKTIMGAHEFRAHGVRHVSALSLRTSQNARIHYGCDVVCIAGGFSPADELLYHRLSCGGVTLSLPVGTQDRVLAGSLGLWTAGRARGADSAEVAFEQGQSVGRSAGRAAHGRWDT